MGGYLIEVILFLLSLFLVILLFFLQFRNRKRQEESVQNANQWMRQLLESMPDTVFVYDENFNIMDVINLQENVMLGFKREDLIGLNVTELGKKNPSFIEAGKLISKYLEKTIRTKETCVLNYAVYNTNSISYSKAQLVPFGKNQVACFVHDVTAHAQAEMEVLKLKTFLQSIVDNLPIGLLVKDVSNNYRYLFYNDKMADFFGDNHGFQLGKNDFETHDENAELYRKEDLIVEESDQPLTFERIRYDEETGMPCRWGLTTKTRLINNDGSCYIIAVMTDTTDIRKKEMELENTRKELSIALDAGGMSAWAYDVDRKWFTSIYNETVSNDGMSLEQGAEMVHPDDREKYMRFIELLSSGTCDKKREIFRFWQGSSYNFFETYSIALKSSKTGNVYQIIGTQKDITDEISRQRELDENRSKLELAFDSAQIIPWEYNVPKQLFTSLKPGVIENQGIFWDEYQTYIYPDDKPLMENGLQNMLMGLSDIMGCQLRVTFPGKDQGWYEIYGTVSERDDNGAVARIIGIRRDITTLKMTDELIDLRNKAEESNRLKSAFLANMSHEIRTPLNAIVGFSNLIAESEDRSEVAEYVRIIETNNELLLQLINDILDLSKIEAGQMDFHYTDFEVAEIFHTMEQTYRSRVKEGVALICELPGRLCRIHSEKNRLTQVISNFLSNACKFTSSGSIQMGFTYTEEGLLFYVKDTGKGIDPENIPNVFQRFAKFDTFVQGTGLGLSISQSIIHHLEGEIGVNSEVEKGSEFWFTLPCHPILI